MTAVCNTISFSARCNMPSANIRCTTTAIRCIRQTGLCKQQCYEQVWRFTYSHRAVIKLPDNRCATTLKTLVWPEKGIICSTPQPAAAVLPCKFRIKIELFSPHWYLDFLSRMKVLISWTWVETFRQPEEPIRTPRKENSLSGNLTNPLDAEHVKRIIYFWFNYRCCLRRI